MTLHDDLQPLVTRWLVTQRWFAGKGREFRADLEDIAELPGGATTLWLAHVEYADGDHESYQLPLALHSQPLPSVEGALLGSVQTDAGPRWVYDALYDSQAVGAWLTGVRERLVHPPLRFEQYTEIAPVAADAPSLVLTGEQSNTSVIFGDVAILKVFRRLQPGVNPDIEVGRALTDLGCAHVPLLLGAVFAEPTSDEDEASYALAMLQEYLTTATDGWELAKASVRDLMAEADLHADEAGGDFAAEAHRLGAAVASVHVDLAAAFGSGHASTEDLADRIDAMHARLDFALTAVAELDRFADGLRELFAGAAAFAGTRWQRIHGDLHLGQALRTVRRWVLIDFEGEPMAEIGQRRRPDSPLRDVAGMLRSFEYAGHQRSAEPGFTAQLAYRAEEWSRRNREAFLDGYTQACGHDPRAELALLRAFEADKTVYETVYEARHRPSWLPIPLASLHRLTGEGAA